MMGQLMKPKKTEITGTWAVIPPHVYTEVNPIELCRI